MFGIPYYEELERLKKKNVNLVQNRFIENSEFDGTMLDFGVLYIEPDDSDPYYTLDVNVAIYFDEEDGYRKWLEFCFEEFTAYMERNGYDTSMELNTFQVFIDGFNIKTHFKSIEESYAFVKFTLNGFHGREVSLFEID